MLCCTAMIVRLIDSEEDAGHEKGCSRHKKQEICKALVKFVLIILREKKEGSGFILFGFFLLSLPPNKTGRFSTHEGHL